MNLHPLTPLANLTWKLRCRNCRGGSGPHASSILGVRSTRPSTADEYWDMKQREKLERETGLKRI
jgi:hypothetical protein